MNEVEAQQEAEATATEATPETVTEEVDAVVVETPVEATETYTTEIIVPETSAFDEVLLSISEGGVYMLGLSFILGSLFTILVLLLLDFMRRSQSK